jgi:creatinine amidohydrolase/Fe(II)-dependent formamide hydrolase-like protein
MLKALDGDPGLCGYTKEQIEHCLKDLPKKGVHQEDAGAEQLAHMLVEKGLIPAAQSEIFPAKPRPEALVLRFHGVRSPVEAIPSDLRAGVYGILLSHTNRAVVKSGRLWKKFDPLSKQALAKPFHLESKPNRRLKRGLADSPEDVAPTRYLLAELTWPEAEARFKQVDVALLPVGAVEQHGPHLPLDTDAFDAEYLAKRVAEGCSSPKPLVFPTISYGVSYHHEDFSGTLSVSPETLARLVHEVGICAARCGITKLVIINGHGGNSPALHLGAQMINRDTHIFTCVETGETSDSDVHEMISTPNDVHAGEIETSTTLAVRPELVKMAQAPRMIPQFSSRYLNFSSRRSVGWYAHTEKISKSGVMGDATQATAEKGARMWAVMTLRLVELIEDLKNLSLDEIYQRRY